MELVVVSLPSFVHAQAAIDALQAGKHVVCEKPMATALADADRMVAALYGIVHLVEGWGLWRAKAWASWLGCITAALYLPFDIYAFATHRHWLEGVVVVVNLLVVWVLARDLLVRRR